MIIVCKCGYQGNQVIQYESSTPSKQLLVWNYSNYTDHVEWLQRGTKTLNWSCPRCGNILVRQVGGLSYDRHELTEMRNRLARNSIVNERFSRARKLLPGKYEAKVISVRKRRNKNRYTLTFELKDGVVIKENTT